MRGACTLLVAVLGLPFTSLGTVHAEKVAVAPAGGGSAAAGQGKQQDNFQTSHDHNRREDSDTQRRQGATSTATGGGRSRNTGGTASTADSSSATCSETGGSQAASCVLEASMDDQEGQQQQQQQQQGEEQATIVTRQQEQQRQRQQEQQQRQQRQQRQQQQQQQQQQQREQARQGPGGGVAVKTGEQDGVRIDFLGSSDGTSPELAPPSSPPTRAAAAKQKAEEAPQEEDEEQLAGRESLSAAAAAAEMPFGLLRCDGESYRDGKEGGLTVKSVCDHMLSKLMESAQRVAPNTVDGSEKGDTAAAKYTLSEARGAVVNAGFGQALVMATAPMSYVFGVLGGVPGWFSDVVFEVRLKEGETDEDLPRRLLLVQNPPRSLEMACSLLAPPLLRSLGSSATATTAGGVKSAAATILPRLVRTLCSADSPFPGKMVSRPCRMEAAPPTEWISTTVQAALSAVGLGGDGGIGNWLGGDGHSSTSTSSVGGGVCECEMRRGGGGGGACTIRTSPGRDPCLYLEKGDISKGGGAKKKGGLFSDSAGETFGVESVDASSYVELRTLRVSTAPITTMTTAESSQQAGRKGPERGGKKTAVVADTLAALQAAVAEQELPSSVGVPVYAARLVAGAVLLFLARPLSESRLFHYLLSAMLGGVFGATALALRTLASLRRSPLRVLLFLGLAMWLAVTVGGDVVLSPGGLLSSLVTWALAFWRDGFDSFPWAGKAFFLASSLGSVLMTRWQGLFLDEGDGPRGTWLNGQTYIRRVLTISGVLLVYYGVSDAEVGVALVLLALTVPTLAHYARRFSMWSSSSGWYRAGNKLSQSEYEKQGDEYTSQAVAALRATTTENWPLVKKLKNQASRRRMTAFAQSGEHFAPTDEENETTGGRCSVQ